MTRRLFGGTIADNVCVSNNGVLTQPGVAVTLTFWDDPSTLTFPLTDLTDINGNPITTVSTNVAGQIPQFFGPNDGHQLMWADANGGAGPRQLILGYSQFKLAPSGATTTANLNAGATETILASGTIPAGLKSGATIRITAWGTIAVGGTAGTVTPRIRIGGLTGVVAHNLTTASLTVSTTYNWLQRVTIQLHGVGAAAPFEAVGEYCNPVSGSSGQLDIRVNTGNTFDNTIAQTLVATLVASSATTSAICKGALVEQVVS